MRMDFVGRLYLVRGLFGGGGIEFGQDVSAFARHGLDGVDLG